MKGLILNNLYSVDKSIKSSILISIAAVTVLILSQNTFGIRAAAFLPFLLIPVNAFESLKHDHISAWNKFELTLPVKRRQIVQSKYATFLILFAISVLVAVGMFYIISLFTSPLNETVFFDFMLRGMGMILCIAVVLYPLTYILGTEKSDVIMILSMGFAFAMFGLVFMLLYMTVELDDQFDRLFSICFFGIAIVLLIVSYIISNIIYLKKEF